MSTTLGDEKKNNEASFKTIVEGSAKMKYPGDQEQSVFYNPVQVQNRDLSVLMISLYAERRKARQALQTKKKKLNKESSLTTKERNAKLEEYKQSLDGTALVKNDGKENGLTVLDALAASGLRSIRYWKEIPGINHVTINDMDPLAVQRARDNLEFNELKVVEGRDEGISIQHGDATHEMYLSRRTPGLHQPKPHELGFKDQYDVIDLDPYGSAAPFLDAAVQAVVDGGMLCVTCTDMAALGGSHPETAYGRYASMPIANARYLQEVALRILLYTISTSAAKYGRTMTPVLSVGMAFYVRVFVEIRNDKAGVNELSTKIGNVYQSTQCPSFYTMPHGRFGQRGKNVYQPSRVVPGNCEETGAPFKVGGPMWLGTLHDTDVVQAALDRLESNADDIIPDMDLIATRDRLKGLLTSCVEELPDCPLYYTLPDLCRALGMACPPLQKVQAAICNAGYRVSAYHKEPQAIKTDAPNRVVWDILRAWCLKNPPIISKKKQKKQAKNNNSGDAAAKILAVKPSIEVDFETIPKELKERKKASRFPLNPEKNWGPKPASGMFSKKRKADEQSEE